MLSMAFRTAPSRFPGGNAHRASTVCRAVTARAKSSTVPPQTAPGGFPRTVWHTIVTSATETSSAGNRIGVD
jgi:hypothetical protein